MGAFYGSVQVRTTDRPAVKLATELVAKGRSIRCLIGPELNGWVGVYPKGPGQDDSFGKDIAELIEADVLNPRSWEIWDYRKLREAGHLIGRAEKPTPKRPGDDIEDLSKWRRAKTRPTI